MENRRVRSETIHNMTSLVFHRVEREDAGEYSLTLGNSHGSNTLKVKVIVLGKFLDVPHKSTGGCISCQVRPSLPLLLPNLEE